MRSPHPKRALRIKAWDVCLNAGTLDGVSHACGKMKQFEWAKPGKVPRLFVDMGYRSVLAAGYVMEHIKSAFEHLDPDVRYCGHVSKEALREVFSELISPDLFKYWYHSDDSCVAIQCVDGTFRANVDISSCDGSHTDVPFEILQHMANQAGVGDQMRRSLDQLLNPLTIRDDDGNIILQAVPSWKVLYSGHTATTAINNIANHCMGLSLRSRVEGRPLRLDECEELIRTNAEELGYIVTVEVCTVVQSIQFLKHSPTENGEPWVNLGVLIRSFGSTHGDFPGRGDLASRAEEWCSGIVASYVHAGDSSILTSLRRRFNKRVSSKVKSFVDKETRHHGYCGVTVSDEDICARYNVDLADVRHMCHLIENMEIGSFYSCILSRAAMEIDYGL